MERENSKTSKPDDTSGENRGRSEQAEDKTVTRVKNAQAAGDGTLEKNDEPVQNPDRKKSGAHY